MRNEDWPTVRQLFEEALSMDPADRAAWIASRAAGDVAREVTALLLADSISTSLLDRPETLLGLDVPLGEPEAEDPADLERIGPFEVRGVLGEGRSGVVYRAWQASPPREVALKVLRISVWSKSGVHRFETEGRALARLSHPGIARIYEVGEFREAAGVRRPYLVMELVDGAVLITEGARSRGVPERLGILIDLCGAVAHAHQRGVLHRDLKPGNVLLDASGQVKVIDFGIARLNEDGPRATVSGQLLGTPAYMSPEQVAGQETDTRTDIHALGLIARDVMGADAVGDLAVVIAKATAREPDGRYQSVGELAADLARVRAGEPVAARPPTPLYLLRTFVRRNRSLSLAIAAGVLGLLAGAVALVVAAERITLANEDARDSAAFLLDNVIARVEDRMGSAAERRRLALELLPRVERLAQRSGDDHEQVSIARLVRVLGDTDQGEGRLADALGNLRRELDIRTALAAAHPDDPQRQAELSISMVRVGDLLKDLGDPAAALDHYERAMALDRRLAAEHPSDMHLASNLAYSCQRLGDQAMHRGDIDTAERLVREQVTITSALLRRQPDDVRRRREAAEAQSTLWSVLRARSTTVETVAEARVRIAAARELLQHDPDSRKSAVNLVSVLHSAAGSVAGSEEQLADSLAFSEEALRLARRISNSDPESSDMAAWVVRVLVGRTTPLIRLGRTREALEYTREALEAMTVLDPRWDSVESASLWRDVLANRCIALREAGRLAETGPLARERARALRALAEEAREPKRTEYQLFLLDAMVEFPDPSAAEEAERRELLDRFRTSDDLHTVLQTISRLTRAGRAMDAIAAADRVLSMARPDQALYISEARRFREYAQDVLRAGTPAPR